MDTRVSAFDSLMSQVSQEFLFVFIAPLETFLHHLEVVGNPFFWAYKMTYFRNFWIKKSQNFFGSKLLPNCFHMFSCYPRWLLDAKTRFLLSIPRHKSIFEHIKWHNFEIFDLKNLKKFSKFFFAQNCCQFDFTCFRIFPDDFSLPKHIFYHACYDTNPFFGHLKRRNLNDDY